jgi:hypothetical protein
MSAKTTKLERNTACNISRQRHWSIFMIGSGDLELLISKRKPLMHNMHIQCSVNCVLVLCMIRFDMGKEPIPR